MSDDPKDYIIEKVEKGPEGESSQQFYYSSVNFGKDGLPLKAKLKLWALVIGGIAAGTLLFLFFLTAFIYLFIPLLILFALWNLFTRNR